MKIQLANQYFWLRRNTAYPGCATRGVIFRLTQNGSRTAELDRQVRLSSIPPVYLAFPPPMVEDLSSGHASRRQHLYSRNLVHALPVQAEDFGC